MKLVLCDWCPKEEMVDAGFRVEFKRINLLIHGDDRADKPLELCKRHYDEFYQSGNPAWAGNGFHS